MGPQEKNCDDYIAALGVCKVCSLGRNMHLVIMNKLNWSPIVGPLSRHDWHPLLELADTNAFALWGYIICEL